MADKKLSSGSTDRARRINSLHKAINSMIQEQDKKRLQVSNEINSLTKEQQKLMQQLDMERSEFTTETAAAYNGVVKNLGKTIQNLSIGVKNITMDTAKTTSSAISQYSKAIGEDISVNKQNTIAMALSRATPLFGYFAAKFMETDVFQSAAAKMKEKTAETFSKASESLVNVFKKKQSAEVSAVPPKLQEGGFIKKGGMVEVHAAEVVTPVDKILEKIDPTNSQKVIDAITAVKEEIKTAAQIDPPNSQKVIDAITAVKKEIKTTAQTTQEQQQQLVKSISELRAGMIGSAERMQIGWQKTILENPALRAMTTFGQLMDTVIKTPFKVLFGIRGGFLGDVRRATRTSNIFQQQVNLLALIYSKGMRFLRNIDKYTKVVAEALVGEEVSPTSSKTYTLFGRIREFMTTRKIGGIKQGAFDRFAEGLGLDKGALREAGITSFADLLSPGTILRNMGITKSNIFGKVMEGPGGGEEMVNQAKDLAFDTRFAARGARRRLRAKMGALKVEAMDVWEQREEITKKAMNNVKTFPGRVIDEMSRIRKAEEDREEREGPHSPSMAENIAETARITKEKAEPYYKVAKKSLSQMLKNAKIRAKWEKRRLKKEYINEAKKQKQLAALRKEARLAKKGIQDSASIAKKNRKDAKGWIPMIVGFASNLFSKVVFMAKKLASMTSFLLGPFYKLAQIGFGAMKGIGEFFGKGVGGMLRTTGTGVARLAGGARGALAGGGVRGLMGWAGRGALGIAGAGAAAISGMAVGGGMALWDMARAMISGDEIGFVGNFIVRGLAGFIGGTDTGAGGMAKGALKGGAIGAAIGSVVPGLGTAIGGGIGAAAGAILGFVGGARISEAINNTLRGISEVVTAIWNIVKFPFQLLREVVQSIWVVLEFAGSRLSKKVDEWLSNIPIVGRIWEGFKNVVDKISGFFGKMFSAIGGFISSKGGLADLIKQGITDFLFPIPNLIAGLKEIGNIIDEWLLGLPIVGRAYKWAKRAVKSIRSGDMSDSLRRVLEGKPEPLTDEQKDMMTAKQIAEYYAMEKEIEQKFNTRRTKEQTNSLIENANQNTEKRNQVQVSTTNVITSNISNAMSGGGTQQAFPSVATRYMTGSQNLASSIASGNIN